MSIKVMSWVWDNAPVEGTDLLVLLVLADHASDDGGNAWPSVARIAMKVRRTQRRVQQSLASLQKKGLINVETNAGGNEKTNPSRRPNRYTIIMRGMKDPSPQLLEWGEDQGSNGVKPTSPNPSSEPSISNKRDVLWDALMNACGYDPNFITASIRGRMNKALKELREVNATPEQIERAASSYRKIYPGMQLTPNALAANWAQIMTTQVKVRHNTCEQCGQKLDHHDDEICALVGNR